MASTSSCTIQKAVVEQRADVVGRFIQGVCRSSGEIRRLRRLAEQEELRLDAEVEARSPSRRLLPIARLRMLRLHASNGCPFSHRSLANHAMSLLPGQHRAPTRGRDGGTPPRR